MTGMEIVAANAAALLAKNTAKEDESQKKQLQELAKDTAEMQAAARVFVKRVAVKQEIRLKLLSPLAKWFGVSREYFDNQFEDDLAAKMSDVPEENVTVPALSVAVPAIQGLGYSLDEPNLKDMYLSLLAAASDDRRSADTHPSFPEIIKQLSAKEARVLAETLRTRGLPIARLRRRATDGTGGTLVHNHVLPWRDDETDEPAVEPYLAAWVDNWIRLGLVDVDYGTFMTAEGSYDYVPLRPGYLAMAESDERGTAAIEVTHGVLRHTDFGKQFAAVVLP